MSEMIRGDAGQVLAVPREIEPFEISTLGLCLIYGLVGSAAYDRLAGRSIKLYPILGGRIFLALLAIGSFTALLGVLRNNLSGLRLERAGLWLLVSLGASYTIWTPFSVGWSGLSVILFFGIMLWIPGAIVARRRGLLIDEVEGALSPDGRPEVPDDGQP